MATETMTLTEFLLARIAEDEAAARAGISSQADPENGWGYVNDGVSRGALTPHVGIIHEPIQAAHIIRWHPARVLAECEARRRIVELRSSWNFQAESMSEPPFGPILQTQVNTADAILRALTLPYVDHPDYNPDWRP